MLFVAEGVSIYGENTFNEDHSALMNATDANMTSTSGSHGFNSFRFILRATPMGQIN